MVKGEITDNHGPDAGVRTIDGMSIEEFRAQPWRCGTRVLYRDKRHMSGVWGEVTGVDFSGTVSVRTGGCIAFVRYNNILEVAE